MTEVREQKRLGQRQLRRQRSGHGKGQSPPVLTQCAVAPEEVWTDNVMPALVEKCCASIGLSAFMPQSEGLETDREEDRDGGREPACPHPLCHADVA